MNLSKITEQVQHNCDISDARHAGIYSVCGLAMRLRDLYKWDRRLPPWEEHGSGPVLDWIGKREELWESLADEPYGPLTVGHREFDAFDSQGINAILAPQGLFYGAGYAHGLRPTFFLAQIEARQTILGRTVWRLGHELARDLLTLPAFSQDDDVVLRCMAARMFVWDQMAYIQNAGRPALAFALSACCNLPDTDLKRIRPHLDAILSVQQDTFIRHELSELDDQVFDRATWRQMLADFPHTAVELLARTLKDILADTGPQGPLHHFIAHRNQAAIGFYMAFSNGLVPLLFGELKAGFGRFMENHNWDEIAEAASTAYKKASDYARQVMEIYSFGRRNHDLPHTRKAIEETLYDRGVHRPDV